MIAPQTDRRNNLLANNNLHAALAAVTLRLLALQHLLTLAHLLLPSRILHLAQPLLARIFRGLGDQGSALDAIGLLAGTANPATSTATLAPEIADCVRIGLVDFVVKELFDLKLR
jgi:hypothetical protein